MTNDLSMIHLDQCYSKVGESFTLSGVVKSATTIPISNYEITYSVGDGASMSKTIESPLAANETDTFKIEVPIINEAGIFTLHASVTKVNGTEDVFGENSMLETKLFCKEYLFSRKVVVEEGTRTWCQWCPRGIVAMREMKNKYSDSYIGIAVHSGNGDNMVASSYNDFVKKYYSGFLSCVVNRKKEYIMEPKFSNIEKVYLREGLLADAGIKANARYVSEDFTTIEVNTQTIFGFSEENAAYRVAVAVLENGVTGYTQANAYAGGGNGEMGGFEKEGSTVKMDFDDVARGIFKSYTSILKSVPTSLVKGEAYTYSYELTLPSSIQNKENIEIVVFLLNSTTDEVMNADKIKIDSQRVGVKQTDPQLDFHIYAEARQIKVKENYDNLQVFTIDGKLIDNIGLYSGIYLVRVAKGSHISVRKTSM